MTAKEWFIKAQKENFAIGAFNVDNLEILNAICMAGQRKNSPVMLEFSQGEVGYFGIDNVTDIVENAKEHFGIPILLNLDHAKKVEDCLAALRLRSGSGDSAVGFDQVHFDGSELELAENISECKKVVEAAHAKGVLVEGEIDRISGTSEVHSEEIDLAVIKNSYTDPQRAAEFVAETGVDIFAAIFGNVHGTFPIQPDLDFDLLGKIRLALPNTFLSLHGGSGIPADQVKEAIKVGKIVKVNVNTELRIAFRDAISEKMQESPEEVTYYKLTPDVVESVMAVVEGKIDVFGSAGRI